MKENEKRGVILLEQDSQNKVSNLHEDNKNVMERFKKPLIFVLMGIVFLGSMYMIFKPSSDKKGIENMGLNDTVPQASEAAMQSDKQKAYEQEILEEKEEQKHNDLTTLADYWNKDNSSNEKQDTLANQEDQSTGYGNNSGRSYNPALNSYRNAQSTLGSFYQDGNAETQQLRRQLEELKEKLAEKDVPKIVTVDDQLALMEKSYQLAAKYLPSDKKTTKAVPGDSVYHISAAKSPEAYFTALAPTRKNRISSLYREPTDSVFLANWSESRNRNFYTAGLVGKELQPKNSIKACVQETQIIAGESGVRLRLLEPAQTPAGTIAKGTILTANAKFETGRLQMKVTSIELGGTIIPVAITIYDLDGQQGLLVPYSPEMNALTEMAGNMSQTSGTSLMLTQSAGQQAAADLSRGVVQGISGYFSKKVRTPKVTLKAGHQVLLVSKN